MMISIEMILYPLGVLLYFQLLRRLERRFSSKRQVSDEEWLWIAARDCQCSEYDIFHIAAKEWHVPTRRIDGDFKAYLVNLTMPHYVRDFVRKYKERAPSENAIQGRQR
jgi:hypothetical protein